LHRILFEGNGFELQVQRPCAAIGLAQLFPGWPALELRVLRAVLCAAWVAEVLGAALVHDVDQHLGHVLGHPVENRIGAAFDMVRHDQMPDGEVLPPVVDEGELPVTVSQYHGVFARRIAQGQEPNLKSGSHTSMTRRRIFMVSSVMKKLLFHSMGTLNAPA
jgi:hypothetical protein